MRVVATWPDIVIVDNVIIEESAVIALRLA